MKKVFRKLKYHFDQFLSKGTISLVLSLLLLMIFIVVAIGFIVYLINPAAGLGPLIWISFMQTLDPGNLSGESGSIVYMIMMTIATFVGLFITSLFISFILNGFQNRLENLSRGRSKVIEKNHTLILGWNDNIYVILTELIEANKSLKRPKIVILSDVDSVEMNNLIRDNILNTFNTKIICRTGSIYKNEDLDMCNIAEAKSVIINEDDMNTIKSLLVVVNSDFYKIGLGHISALMYDELNISVAKSIGKDRLEIIYLKSSITRIIAQTCLQPGLSYVYNELLEFKGDEIYFYESKNMIGQKFSDLTLGFDNAILIGIMKGSNPFIRPDADTIIEENDQLILISEDEDTFKLNIIDKKIDFKNIVDNQRQSSKKLENVLVIGFNRKTLSVIAEFNNYLLKGSKIEVLVNSQKYVDEIISLKEKLTNLDIECFIGETYKREVLNKYVDKSCNSIIIFANENVSHKDQDSQTLLTLLHLRDMEEELKTRFDIITEIYDVRNSEIIDLAKVDDFIISELIANKMLAQVSENRYLKEIFDHLLSDEGSEIYLKPITDYISINEAVDFYTLTKAALLKNEIAIGYKIYKDNDIPFINVNPFKPDKVKFKEKDSIIVISED